ncbi:2-iminoacetate synthase ThiH [Heliorestis acidaminivorans]|uniref:2-iminoacetate synthase ThiH n=1 Tax=Heliorestis acidaminivorans TaxID=553427 RepID=A0A6I0EUV2_9FIRM|nr:2-iminoacetate synthase ThiH [Heliorestis acidaminivorans]KAB2954555.1 2-iminoacetate synthase ThiH [Heliorestis acidaminivorans]
MSFYPLLQKYKDFALIESLQKVTPQQVAAILRKDRLQAQDFLALLSPTASSFLEEMAQKANRLTIQHFGRTVQLYTPLYLSNLCVNRCLYCNFNHLNESINRRRLSPEEIEAEAKAIAHTGLKQVLLLTGDVPGQEPLQYLVKALDIVNKHFTSISIEINALSTDDYALLVNHGVDGLTIYQEVYDESTYEELHPKGPKRDYLWRLDAPERGCQAGMRRVNIGTLLGLHHWPTEVFFTGLHAQYLQDRYLDTEISISIPRIKAGPEGYQPQAPVSDRDLVQIILAFRLFMPRLGITLSTRESASLRDNLIPLGVTKLSSGVNTAVGGHIDEDAQDGQFTISDERSTEEISQMLIQQGYQPVFQDWHNL